MSRISKAAKSLSEERKEEKILHKDEQVINHMGGTSYTLSPIETLKMVAASSIFGEPQYYHDDKQHETIISYAFGKFNGGELHEAFLSEVDTDFMLMSTETGKLTRSQLFEKVIDDALEYDFGATLEVAATLRHDYYMRLNPQVIMVRAAIHPKRKEWTDANPGKFKEIEMRVMSRADEPATQAAYYLFTNDGNKNKMPSVLKRSIKEKLERLTRYQINKYKNAEIGMINTVRLVHASSDNLNELMKTGTIQVDTSEKTWEQYKSEGKDWKWILANAQMGHMALLRNIRNIFNEIDDHDFAVSFCKDLKDGVRNGKQFPFRYESAYRALRDAGNVNHKGMLLDCLEECIDISIDNMPHLKGKTIALSDNSGSAWGTFNSEFGSQTVANIDNLSAVIACMASDEGVVGKFGDEIKYYHITKRNGALIQATNVDEEHGYDVGHSTEGGIWKFFEKALEEKVWYDNIFIFSDMQAGTGGLYGTPSDRDKYNRLGYGFTGFTYHICTQDMINVYKLVLDYRKKVNPKVNVFCVQTAGYNNSVIPEMGYRFANLYGWTGKEVQFAAEYIKQWDEIEAKRESQKKLDETMNDIVQEIVSDKQYTDESILDATKLDDKSKQEAFDKLTKDMSSVGTAALATLLNAYGKMTDEERKKFFDDINK